MARLNFVLAALFFGAWLVNAVAAASARDENIIWIESPRRTNWGTWGDEEFCPEGQYVYGFRLKVQADQGWLLDDTAVNAIELLCEEPSRTAAEEAKPRAPTPIRSKEGPQGNWGTVFECDRYHFGHGFELRSEGPTLDNTAGNNLRLSCTNEYIHQGNGHSWGDWTGHLNCPRGMWVCGIRTQVEDPKPQPADNTGLNNVDFACCDEPEWK